MISFNQFLKRNCIISLLAEEYFNSSTLLEADDTINYYKRPPQFITMSKHALDDGKARNRLWWDDDNHLSDPKFLDFANKCLDRIKTAPDDYKEDYTENGIKKTRELTLDRNHRGEVGFCDLNQDIGWVTSLRKSEDETFTSFNVVTIFKYAVMNKKLPMFTQPDTYIINVDKAPPQSKNDKLQAEYDSIDQIIKDLTDTYEIAFIEYDDMPETTDEEIKLKRKAKKEIDKLENQLYNNNNRKSKLKTILNITESITVTDSKTGKKFHILMV